MFCGLHGDGFFKLGAGFGEWKKRDVMNGAWEQLGFGKFGYWGLKGKKKKKRKKEIRSSGFSEFGYWGFKEKEKEKEKRNKK